MVRAMVVLSAVALSGCVSQDAFRRKEAEADGYRQDLQAERGRTADLQGQAAGLQGRLDAASAEAERLRGDLAQRDRALAQGRADLDAASARLSEARASQQALEVAKADLEQKSAAYEQLAGSLKTEIEAGRVELTELRGKMTVKMKDKVLFSSGSAALGKDGRNALQAVADALRTVQDKTIRVEGHTDDVPTGKSAFPTNWELSTARALAVVRFLQQAGVDPTRLAAAGYGEYQPIAPNDTPEGRSQNRRIEIVLAPAEGTGAQ
jgi:chemotaxis protein MotB